MFGLFKKASEFNGVGEESNGFDPYRLKFKDFSLLTLEEQDDILTRLEEAEIPAACVKYVDQRRFCWISPAPTSDEEGWNILHEFDLQGSPTGYFLWVDHRKMVQVPDIICYVKIACAKQFQQA